MTKEIKTIKVAEYVDQYNKSHEDKITRHNVYAMIKEGKLTAQKNEKGHWVITLEVEKPKTVPKKPEKEYPVKEFVEKYNGRHPKKTITIKKVRELAASGEIKAKKCLGRWIIMENPNKLIK